MVDQRANRIAFGQVRCLFHHFMITLSGYVHFCGQLGYGKL
jgi:hypothetical protein